MELDTAVTPAFAQHRVATGNMVLSRHFGSTWHSLMLEVFLLSTTL
jgi:hypothetical protein